MVVDAIHASRKLSRTDRMPATPWPQAKAGPVVEDVVNKYFD